MEKLIHVPSDRISLQIISDKSILWVNFNIAKINGAVVDFIKCFKYNGLLKGKSKVGTRHVADMTAASLIV
jgi:hypothetical protein